MYGRYGRFGASIIEEGDQGYTTAGSGSQGYTDVASPPPPPPQVGTASDWSNPWGASGGQVSVSSPPLVSASASSPSGTSTWDSVFGAGQKVLTGLVDIFGRPVTATGQPIVAQPQGMPLWGWVAIGVGGVVVLGIAARSLRSGRRMATAGYRRHRRSRR